MLQNGCSERLNILIALLFQMVFNPVYYPQGYPSKVGYCQFHTFLQQYHYLFLLLDPDGLTTLLIRGLCELHVEVR
jgi:hypothetical protein